MGHDQASRRQRLLHRPGYGLAFVAVYALIVSFCVSSLERRAVVVEFDLAVHAFDGVNEYKFYADVGRGFIEETAYVSKIDRSIEDPEGSNVKKLSLRPATNGEGTEISMYAIVSDSGDSRGIKAYYLPGSPFLEISSWDKSSPAARSLGT